MNPQNKKTISAKKKKVKRLAAAKEVPKPVKKQKSSAPAPSEQIHKKLSKGSAERTGASTKTTANDLPEKFRDPAIGAKDDSGRKTRNTTVATCVNGSTSKRSGGFDVNSSRSGSCSSSEEGYPPEATEKKQNRKDSLSRPEPPRFLFDDSVPIDDSCESAKQALQWLLTPILVESFLS